MAIFRRSGSTSTATEEFNIDGDKGDITVTNSGDTWTIDSGVVTTTKLGGDITTQAKALLDDATAADQRTTLGLGTLATQNGTFSGTSSGTNTGDQNLFSTIAVAGQSNVVANATSDTLTFVAGTNVTITTNAITDAITISANNTSVDWSEIQNKPDPTITLAGDLTGSVTLTDLTSGTLTATIAANSVALGTDTTGNYVASMTAGTGITVGTATGEGSTPVITNTAPDQTVVLTAGTGISTSGTYPNFTVANTDTGSAQNIFKTVAVSGQSNIVADSNSDTLTIAAGAGVNLTTNATTDTLTITNSSPDQTVTISSGSGISVTGTYPSFTVANNDAGSSQAIFKNVAVSGQSTVVANSNNDTLTLVAGANVTITTDAATDTITIASAGGGGGGGGGFGGGGVADGDYGDITVSGTGAVWNIDAGVVTTTELGGDITAAGKALLDDADASAQRTTLGLGTAATTATTDYATAAQGSKADSALQPAAIGTTVQAYDSNLSSFLTTFNLPTVDTTNGKVLATDGAGGLQFVDQTGKAIAMAIVFG